MEGEGLPVDDDGVPGVVPAVELDDVVDVLTELVGRLALPLVSPLCPDDDDGWHGHLSYCDGGMTVATPPPRLPETRAEQVAVPGRSTPKRRMPRALPAPKQAR